MSTSADDLSPTEAAAKLRRANERHLGDLCRHARPPADIEDPDADRWPRFATQPAQSVRFSGIDSPAALCELECEPEPQEPIDSRPPRPSEDTYRESRGRRAPGGATRHVRVTLPQLAWSKT